MKTNTSEVNYGGSTSPKLKLVGTKMFCFQTKPNVTLEPTLSQE